MPAEGDDPGPVAGPAATTASALIRRWVPTLQEAGIDTARLDAELLVASVLRTDRHRLFLDDPLLSDDERCRAEALLRHRAADRVPVAYLVGTRWFDEVELEVTDAVLVPRPETELLVDLAVVLAPTGASVIDVGTGSGAVAIAMARRRPDLRITASDIDAAALEVAGRNALALAAVAPVGERPSPGHIALQHAALLGDWAGEVVVSNPPYVEETVRGHLAPELDHEPPHALYAGPDGLDVIRPLVIECARQGVGLVLLEHGNTQGEAVRELLERSHFRATTQPDLAGLDRITWALRADLWPLTEDQTQALRALR